MNSLGIFIYGLVVTAIVLAALWLLAWGIINERRDRTVPAQGEEVFGESAAEFVARAEEQAARSNKRRSSVTDERGRTRQRPRDHG